MFKPVTDYEIVDHGIEHSQYFQGCGVSFTPYDECFTGIGDNPKEALEDALDGAAQSDWDVESIKNELPEEPSVAEEYPDDNEYDNELHYYVSIRLK